MILHFCDDLRIGQLVCGLEIDGAAGKRLGAAETLLQFQLGLARSEDQNGFRQPQLTDDVVVITVQLLAVALFIFLLPASAFLARMGDVPP